MLLRRWEKGFRPLDLSYRSAPEWITFMNVPPTVISVEGISWISSMIGKPVKRFVRDELNVKVCVLRDKAVICPNTLTIEMEDGELSFVEIEQIKSREYKGKPRTEWQQRESVVVQNEENNSAGNRGEADIVKNPPDTVVSLSRDDQQATPDGGEVVVVANASNKTSRRGRNC
ncbi:hypothetical protein LINPERPRIM_LOCUS14866 [Linum perenne]